MSIHNSNKSNLLTYIEVMNLSESEGCHLVYYFQETCNLMKNKPKHPLNYVQSVSTNEFAISKKCIITR